MEDGEEGYVWQKMGGTVVLRQVQEMGVVCRVEGSEFNIKWESCVVRYVWYVGWKEVS